MLSFKAVTKHFGGIAALEKCSFEAPRHQITAVIGPNGAGKTTLFDVISGLVKADSGSIVLLPPSPTLPTKGREREDKFPSLDGRGEGRVIETTQLLPYQVANLGVSRTFQAVRLFRNLSILDHLTMVESNEDTKLLRNLFPLTPTLSLEGRGRKGEGDYEKYLKTFGIEKPLDTLVSDLSYGQRKLLQLLMAVLKPHEILLLDEPVAGVNKVLAAKIESLLLEFKQQGQTILIIDHDMEFIRRLADKVVVMDEGKVLAEGSPEEALKDQRVLEAYLGE